MTMIWQLTHWISINSMNMSNWKMWTKITDIQTLRKRFVLIMLKFHMVIYTIFSSFLSKCLCTSKFSSVWISLHLAFKNSEQVIWIIIMQSIKIHTNFYGFSRYPWNLKTDPISSSCVVASTPDIRDVHSHLPILKVQQYFIFGILVSYLHFVCT